MWHFILGTRPQLIKMAPLMLNCQKRKINYNYVYMAQHFDTINEITAGFGLKKADFILGNRNHNAPFKNGRESV